MNFSKEEYKARLKKVQSLMQEKGIELLISSDTANMNYLTGYDAWSFYYAQAVIVHVNADEPLCWVRKQDSAQDRSRPQCSSGCCRPAPRGPGTHPTRTPVSPSQSRNRMQCCERGWMPTPTG